MIEEFLFLQFRFVFLSIHLFSVNIIWYNELKNSCFFYYVLIVCQPLPVLSLNVLLNVFAEKIMFLRQSNNVTVVKTKSSHCAINIPYFLMLFNCVGFYYVFGLVACLSIPVLFSISIIGYNEHKKLCFFDFGLFICLFILVSYFVSIIWYNEHKIFFFICTVYFSLFFVFIVQFYFS